MPTLKNNPRYIAVLAAAAGVILLLGTLLRPSAPSSETGSVAPPPADVMRLQRLTLKRNVQGFADYFTELAGQVSAYIVRLEVSDRSAVVWAPERLVTAPDAHPHPQLDRAVGSAERSWTATFDSGGPHLPLAFYQLNGAVLPAPAERFPAQFYTTGGWTMAAWRGADGRLEWAYGQIFGADKRSCDGFSSSILRTSLPLHKEMSGAGLFDLEGALMGVVGVCGDRMAAFDVATVERLARREGTFADHLISRFGMRLRGASGEELERFDAEYGMLIEEVWRGYEAYRAGLRPGDILVDLDGSPVTSVDDLQPLVMPVARETLEVGAHRDGRIHQVELKARGAEGESGPAGLRWRDPPPGVVLDVVEPDSAAAEAGLRPGDRLISVGRETPSSPDEAAELLADAGDEPVYAVVERRNRLWGVWLEP